jgi:beta-lactamase superfamily II metal-dependent hydrolase
MKRLVSMASALALVVTAAATRPAAQAPQPRSTKTLDIYIADTEGGKAALYVTPAGQTVMIDSGNPGERDHGRIMAMLKDAGVTRLDYLISTHYHVDHIGGLADLAKAIPITHFVDHGPSVEPKEQVQGFQAMYAELHGKARHTVAKPGDKLALTGVDWTIVTSAGEVLKKALPGGGRPNPACATVEKKPEPATPDDNGASVGSVITFGQFRVVDLGDLLWNEELELMCPNNPIGTVDLFMVTHHGLAQSNADPLVHGVAPRVAVMQNGTRKGGAVAVLDVLHRSPGLQDVWQLHWSYNAGVEHNPSGVFIANVDDAATIASVLTSPPPAGRGGRGGAAPAGAAPAGAAPVAGGAAGGVQASGAPAAPAPSPAQASATGAGGPPAGQPAGAPGGGRGGGAAAAHAPAYYIKISAQPNGTFTVTNMRNNFSKTYIRNVR